MCLIKFLIHFVFILSWRSIMVMSLDWQQLLDPSWISFAILKGKYCNTWSTSTVKHPCLSHCRDAAAWAAQQTTTRVVLPHRNPEVGPDRMAWELKCLTTGIYLSWWPWDRWGQKRQLGWMHCNKSCDNVHSNFYSILLSPLWISLRWKIKKPLGRFS